MFDIERFLQANNIPIRYSGENVAKGNFNIACPLCIRSGRGDTNFHMGINPEGTYGCWRNPKAHGGRKFEKLVRVLLDCSYEEAYKIVYDTIPVDHVESENWNDIFNKLLDAPDKEEKIITTPKDLLLPKEFIEIKSTGATKKFYDYLLSRGFDRVDLLIQRYSLLCALNGEYESRIIFPIFYDGELVTWTSRSILPNEKLRYKDLSVDKSLIHVKQTLYNYDELIRGGDFLIITEGIFDCIKLDHYSPKGFGSSCIFTKSITNNQIYQITELSKVFKKIILLLDNDAKSATMEISARLSFLPNVTYKFLPVGVKDPGDLNQKQVLGLMEEIKMEN
jgi:hypothetical protein